MLNESNFIRTVCFPFKVFSATLVLWTGVLFAGALYGQSDSGFREKKPDRSLETDRPDATESPVTVDKGFFQIESSLFSYTQDKEAGTRTRSLKLAENNIKYGISNELDLQLVFSPYVRETSETGGVKTTAEGASDLIVRLKHNLWGNDGGSTAFGLMPFVKIPTQTEVSNGRWEGGLIMPFSWSAGERWSMGFQGEIDRVFNDTDRSMDWDLAHTAVVGVEITDRLGIYLEYLGIAGDHPYESYFSNGMTFSIHEFLRLDAGTLVGLNDQSDDITVFSGISFKF